MSENDPDSERVPFKIGRVISHFEVIAIWWFSVSYWLLRGGPWPEYECIKVQKFTFTWFSLCILLFYLPVDSPTHVDFASILDIMLDSIKTNKCFHKEENGRRRPLVPVLHPTRPVWDCPIGCPSRFRLNFTRMTCIHDGRTRITDGAQPLQAFREL